MSRRLPIPTQRRHSGCKYLRRMRGRATSTCRSIVRRRPRRSCRRSRPRRRPARRPSTDLGERQVAAVAPNVLDRSFEAPAPNRKWIADFTYVWTAEGWLYVAAVVDLFSRRVVGWSMNAAMTAQLVTDALV